MAQPKVDADQLDLTSANLPGNPTATTQGSGNNSTRIATTAYVKSQGYAPLASPGLTGNPTAPTQTSGNNSTRLATTAFVQDAVSTVGAGAAFGDVGTYAFAYDSINAGLIAEGTVVPGSDLQPTNANASFYGIALSGSWRCMGNIWTNGSQQDATTLWLRIS